METTDFINYLNKKRPSSPLPKGQEALHWAHVIARGLIDEKIVAGSRLPVQTRLHEELKLPMLTVKRLWQILKELRIIDTNTYSGTNLITDVVARRTQVQDWLRENPIVSEDKRFDRFYPDTLSSPGMKYIKGAIESAKLGPQFSKSVMKKVVQEVIKTIVKKKTVHDYEKNELLESLNYKLLLKHIGNWAISGGTEKEIMFFEPDSFDKFDTLIKKLQRRDDVALVYVKFTSPYPSEIKWTLDTWKKFLEVQRTRGFKILIDDYVTYDAPTTKYFRSITEDLREHVIIITKASVAVQFRSIAIVAGPESLIRFLRGKHVHQAKITRYQTFSALLELCQSGQMAKVERNAYQTIKSLIYSTKIQLTEKRPFNREFIEQQRGFFFYLKPTEGTLTEEFLKLLRKARIHVFDPELFDVKGKFEGGILISIAAYRKSYILEEHLSHLIVITKRFLDDQKQGAKKSKYYTQIE